MSKPTANDTGPNSEPAMAHRHGLGPNVFHVDEMGGTGDTTGNDIHRVATVMAAVKSVDCDTDRDDLVHSGLNLLAQLTVQRIDPAKPLLLENKAPQGLLVITGDSGAGKTHAIRKAIAQNPAFTKNGTLKVDCPISSTSKGLALSLLHATGYPAKDHLAENRVWHVLKEQIRKNRINFIWIDEIQHIFHMPNKKTVLKTSDALKTLTIDDKWPTSVIVSGLPSIKSLWANDNQLKRRKKVVSIPLINVSTEADQLLATLLILCETAGIQLELIPPHLARNAQAFDAAKENFKNRVIYPVIIVNDYALGSSLDFMCEAIRCALTENSPVLAISHFEMALRLKDDVFEEDNIFAFDNWQQVSV